MKTYTLYWRDGKRELVQGTGVNNALDRAGYGAGALRALDFWAEGDDHEYTWLGGEWVKKKYTCETCKDTHMMTLGDREVMCTHCPVPCQKCRAGGNGAYCASTPCACTCHTKTAGVELYSDVTIPALLMHDFEEHVREMLSKFHHNDNRADTYECEFCGAWGYKPGFEHKNDCLGVKLEALIKRQP